MRVNFLTNPVYTYGEPGWEPTDMRLSGTEESIVRWAEELVKRDCFVRVYLDGHYGGDWVYSKTNGVYYAPREYYGTKTFSLGDVCINIKSPEIAPKEPTLYLTNETDATKRDLSKYSGVIWPSQWAEENIPVNNPRRFIVPHGYDPEEIYLDKKIPKQCFYASSPDRGLDALLKAWPKVYGSHPDATLLITYGVSGINLPGVTCLGEVGENTMNEIYRTSEFWLYPCNGGELFGMTGVKAQAAGCWPVYFPTMALSETVKFGKKSTPETFVDDVIDALNGNYELPDPLPKQPTWQDSTNSLLDVINSVLEEKGNKDANSFFSGQTRTNKKLHR